MKALNNTQLKALEVGKAMNALIATKPSKQDVLNIFELVLLPMTVSDRDNYLQSILDVTDALSEAVFSIDTERVA